MIMAPLYVLLGGLAIFALGWIIFLSIQRRRESPK